MGVPSEKDSNSEEHVTVSTYQVDTAAELLAHEDVDFDNDEAKRILKKIDAHLLPLMCTLYWVQFMDKTTLGYAAISGLSASTHLSVSEYNWLGTIFYLSYLGFEYPQNLALQRFPVGKWMSLNIFVWSVALCCHAACKNFGGLLAVRFVLGMCEGSITAGFMIVTSMFYTRTEQTLRVGYWFLMNGIAQIIGGFISFGCLHITTKGFEPWQWVMVVTGAITFITAICFFLMFPDSPTNAWFLTPSERVIAIKRIKENQTGVENKHFKVEQMLETLTDRKTWLFALFAAFQEIPNSLSNQRTIIVTSFGFTNFQTTLLGCVDGIIEIVTIWTGVTLAARYANTRAYIGVAFLSVNLLGAILVNTLPWSNKVGLLISEWLTGFGSTAFVLALSWVSATTAGHTKKVTTNAIMLSAYCVGNAAGPFMWQAKYKPRNHIPWLVIGISYIICMSLLLFIRYTLNRENKRRDAARPSQDDSAHDAYMEFMDDDGKTRQVKVDKEFLDLTDRQNLDFRYSL